ncbi:MAG: hypothetical protein HY507_00205 [Candidatus Zambryskibacteria bacterium]|nr:hypothetical protein [Candidatus Zambryskibacteria bacterium]
MDKSGVEKLIALAKESLKEQLLQLKGRWVLIDIREPKVIAYSMFRKDLIEVLKNSRGNPDLYIMDTKRGF